MNTRKVVEPGNKLITFLVLVVIACGAGELFAQRVYDVKTVETVAGKVVSIDQQSRGRGPSYGLHLTLQTEKETIAIHLGPAWYIEKQKPRIGAGDNVIVTGSRITFDGKPAIVAAQIKKGNEVLRLRDENGRPAWAGGGGRGP